MLNNDEKQKTLCDENSTDTVKKAAELLYDLINHSYETSMTPLTVEINGDNQDIRDFYRNCCDQMKQISKAGQKADFLQMAVLEDTWNKVISLILVPLREMLSGDMKQLENAQKLQELFAADETKAEWKKKAELYVIMLKKMHFDAKIEDFKNLTEIIDPLLDGLTTYDNEYRRKNIYQLRKGERNSEDPAIMTEVCKFGTEKEFGDAVMNSDKSCVIAFGAIEKKEAVYMNHRRKWLDGMWDERHRNIMEHEQLTEEETAEEIAKRSIWLAVKNGENLWMYEMPIMTNYGNIKKYYYGKRSSYAPWNIFFTEFSGEAADTTFLSVVKKGYRLNELMDAQQQAWLPVFLNETIQLFFKDESFTCKEMYFPEECSATVNGTELMLPGVALPAVRSINYRVKTPEEVYPENKELLEMFHVTIDDLKDVPLVWEAELVSKNDYYNHMNEAVEAAYCKIISERVADYVWENVWDARVMFSNLFDLYHADIVKRAAAGEFDDFATVNIDGEPELDKDGRPKMKLEHSWSTELVPIKHHTSSYDGYSYGNKYTTMATSVFWLGEKTVQKKPPVVLKITPVTTADYKKIFGKYLKEEESFPELIEKLDVIKGFEYQKHLSDKIAYIRKEKLFDYDGNKNRSTFVPCLARMNICMRKGEWNALMNKNKERYVHREFKKDLS